MSPALACPHCKSGDYDSLGHHIGTGRCPGIDAGALDIVRTHRDIAAGVPGVNHHRVDFERSVRTVDWDDVPALETAPTEVAVADGGVDEVRELADELEALDEDVWPA